MYTFRMAEIDDGENGGNVEHEPDVTERITAQLQHIQGLLRELEEMQPTLHKDIEAIYRKITRAREQVDIFDTYWEELDHEGKLDEGRFTQDIGKTLTDMGGHLDSLLAEHAMLLDTRMQLETAMDKLRKSRDELLAGIPEDKKQ